MRGPGDASRRVDAERGRRLARRRRSGGRGAAPRAVGFGPDLGSVREELSETHGRRGASHRVDEALLLSRAPRRAHDISRRGLSLSPCRLVASLRSRWAGGGLRMCRAAVRRARAERTRPGRERLKWVGGGGGGVAAAVSGVFTCVQRQQSRQARAQVALASDVRCDGDRGLRVMCGPRGEGSSRVSER